MSFGTMSSPPDISRVAPRSVFLQWPMLLAQGERILDDLARWTRFNTIELSHLFLEGGLRGRGGSDPAAPLALPPEADFDGLPVPTTDAALFESLLRVIELIRTKGFRVGCNLAPLYIGPAQLASLSCVDATGTRVPGHHPQLAVDACPNNPDSVRYGEAIVREFVRAWPLDAVTINHVEYSLWPETGLSGFFTCFCDACRARAESHAFDLAAMQRSVLELYESLTSRDTVLAGDLLNSFIARPQLAQWLNFRMQSMTEFTGVLVSSARGAADQYKRELALGLEHQLPALSRLVGTDFIELADGFDWLTPKFPDYLGASTIPFIADEISSRNGSMSALELGRSLRAVIGLGPGPDHYEPRSNPIDGINYSNTFDLSVFERQMPYLEPVRGKVRLYPYIWHYDDLDLLRNKMANLRRFGFEGFFLWCGERDLDSDALRAASGIL